MLDDAVTICRHAPNAVDVRWGLLSSRGPLDLEDRETLDPSGLVVRERVTVLRVPATHLEDITRNGTVTVTNARAISTVYRVREVESEADGEVKVLTLARAT
jgi:hypothetical protein